MRVLAGAVTFAAILDWAADLDVDARGRLGFTGPIPVGSTVWRFLIRLDAEVLQAVLTGWLRSRITPPPAEGSSRPARSVIAVDGKVLRGARLPDGRQIHLLAAYDTATGLVLAQRTIATKSNEIPAFVPLLDQVETILGSLTGVVVVADALHAQVAHADYLAARGAHLPVTAKATQPTLHRHLRALPWAQVSVGHRTRDRGAQSLRDPNPSKPSPSRPPVGWGFPMPPKPFGSPEPGLSPENQSGDRLPDRVTAGRTGPTRGAA